RTRPTRPDPSALSPGSAAPENSQQRFALPRAGRASKRGPVESAALVLFARCSSLQRRRSRPRSAVNSSGSRQRDGVGSLKSCPDEEGGLRRETYRTAVGGD